MKVDKHALVACAAILLFGAGIMVGLYLGFHLGHPHIN